MAGFVGRGHLSAAVSGEIFASPSAEAVTAAIRAVAGPQGCLVVVMNYTGKPKASVYAPLPRMCVNASLQTCSAYASCPTCTLYIPCVPAQAGPGGACTQLPSCS